MEKPMQPDDTLRLDIAGMTCASCVNRVEKALRKVDGVREASVNLATETAAVTADGVSPQALLQAVERAGYQARVHVETAAPARQSEGMSRETLHLLLAALLSL